MTVSNDQLQTATVQKMKFDHCTIIARFPVLISDCQTTESNLVRMKKPKAYQQGKSFDFCILNKSLRFCIE